MNFGMSLDGFNTVPIATGDVTVFRVDAKSELLADGNNNTRKRRCWETNLNDRAGHGVHSAVSDSTPYRREHDGNHVLL